MTELLCDCGRDVSWLIPKPQTPATLEQSLASAILAGDEGAQAALFDLLTERREKGQLPERYYPKDKWDYCERCDQAGAHTYHPKQEGKTAYRTSPLFLEVEPGPPWQGSLGCWYCWQSGRKDPISVYTECELLASAGAWRADQMIRCWEYYQAPALLQLLSNHGGDEDNIGLVPPSVSVPFWMESGSRFGVCDVQEVVLPSGWKVMIGAHA